MSFFKCLIVTSIMTSSSLFAMQIIFPQPNEMLSRKNVFIIKEYLKACASGNTKKAAFLLSNATTSHIILTTTIMDETNTLHVLDKSSSPLAAMTDRNGLTGLMLAAGNGHSKTLRAILPFHHSSEIAMKDTIKGYDAKTWAEYHDWEKCVLALEEATH